MNFNLSDRFYAIIFWIAIIYGTLFFCYLIASYQLPYSIASKIEFNPFTLIGHFNGSLRFLGLALALQFLIIFAFVVALFPYKKVKTVTVATIFCCLLLSYVAGNIVSGDCSSQYYIDSRYDDFVSDGGKRDIAYENFRKIEAKMDNNRNNRLDQCNVDHAAFLRVSYGEDYFSNVFLDY